MLVAAQQVDLWQLAGQIKVRAKEAGFDLVGIAPAEKSRYAEYFKKWLGEGQAGTMQWLAGRTDERLDPAVYLPGAKSVVCVGMNYYVQLEPLSEEQKGRHGRIARYALGEDYHEVMKKRLHLLADWIRQSAPTGMTRAAVDTAPVMEKELAGRAGVGWMGKNTCIINEEIGSWLLLGEIITTLDLPTDDPALDRCGSCTRCIDACPTGAIVVPYQLDARQCISYLTIEHREQIAEKHQSEIGDWLYGCDICQDVCPWNKKAPEALDPALRPRFGTGTLNIDAVLGWDEQEYAAKLKGSAMKRVKLPMLKRNAQIVRENLSE